MCNRNAAWQPAGQTDGEIMIPSWMKLLRRQQGGQPASRPVEEPPPPAPAAEEAAEEDVVPVTSAIGRYLLRQPILNQAQHIIGYELALRNQLGVDVSASTQTLADETLLSSVVQLDLRSQAGRRHIFITLGPDLLDSSWIAMLPAAMVVLIVDAERIAEDTMDHLLAVCQKRAADGFQLGLSNLPDADWINPLLVRVQWLKFDLRQLDAIAFSQQAENLRSHCQARILVSNVDTQDDFQAAGNLGFDAFEGYYFATRNPQAPRRIDNDRVRIMELLNLAASKAPYPELEQGIKHDVLLSYRLLTYINSPLNPLSRRIDSIAQALMYLGYEPLYRWLTLLLYVKEEDGSATDAALLQNALVRGRIMETLGRRYLTAEDADSLFVTGMFSLLDVLLNVPMTEALAQLSLRENVSRALLEGHGPYAPYLRLAIAFEDADQKTLSTLADELLLDPVALNGMHYEAINWAMQLGVSDRQ